MNPAARSRIASTLGGLGGGALVLIGCAIAFQLAALRPLEARRNALERQLAAVAQPRATPALAASASLDRFYRFLETGADAPTQLARLYVIGKAAGIDLRAAEYRVHKAGPRMVRYEIALPLSAGYVQIRTFLREALFEIPMLSLDRISIRKERPGDPGVQADVRLTLYLVQS